MCVYIYIYMCVCVYMHYIYMCIYSRFYLHVSCDYYYLVEENLANNIANTTNSLQ